MLKNYFKITIAVLLRRKFLTLVNLFGIVLTLTVLVVAFAIFQSVVNPGGAERGSAHVLSIHGAAMLNSTRNFAWRSNPGIGFFNHYVKPLKTPDLVSFATNPGLGTSYHEGTKLTVQIRFTDATYWQILNFNLLAGRLLAPDDIQAGRHVVVINEATADVYFHGEPAVGKSIVVDSQPYEVVGVVSNEPLASRLAFADVWAPLTSTNTSGGEPPMLGDGQIMLYTKDPTNREAMRRELQERVRRFETNPDPGRWDTLIAFATTKLEMLAARVMRPRGNMKHYVALFVSTAIGTSLLFMLLPALNLINLNIGRMMERAPEIGLRKASGASTRELVGQFVFENLVLTFLGGLLALAIAPVVLLLLNDVLRYGELHLSPAVMVAGLAFVATFGVLSGAYPAWKMARLDPASALKGQRNV